MKKKWLSVSIIILTIIIGCVLYLSITSKEDTNSKEAPKSQETLITINNDEALQLLNEKKTGLLYVGRPTCPMCVEFLPIFKKALKDEKRQAYYYNTDDNSVEEEKFNEVLAALNVRSVPVVLEIEQGKVRKILQGKNEYDQVIFWLNQK